MLQKHHFIFKTTHAMTKPFSQACENNKAPILVHLKRYFSGISQVLEIGSGTGQHSVYFAQHLPHLRWQTSDLNAHHHGILQWHLDAKLDNVLPPITLDLNHPWPVDHVEAIFTANTLHIVSRPLVEHFFKGIKQHLIPGGLVGIYGPFKYQGHFTSESNQHFDTMLKAHDPKSGIRDSEWIETLARQAGLSLLEDISMPANNRLLFFQKTLSEKP